MDVEGALERARVLLDLRRPVEARTLLGDVITAAPENPTAWCLLAYACLRCADPSSALDASGRAVALAPDAEWPHRLRSLALVDLGQRDEAVESAEEAIRRGPLVWQAHAHLAGLLAVGPPLMPRRAKAQVRALAAARKAAELAPDEPHVYVRLAQAHAQRREWRLMRAAEAHALALAPGDPGLCNDVAAAQLHTGYTRRAAAGFARAAALDPTGPAAANFVLACRGLLEKRIHMAMWLLFGACFAAQNFGGDDPARILRWWSALVAAGICAVLLGPLATLARRVEARHRRAVLAIVRTDRRIAREVTGLAVCWALAVAGLVLPTPALYLAAGGALAAMVYTGLPGLRRAR